jgi:aubergine-like protein
MQNLSNSIKDFRININLRDAVKCIPIQRDRSDKDWIEASKRELNPTVDFAIYIINGPKNGSRTYKAIKSFLINSAPIPSQVINSKTLGSKRNLRSIINKILIQINAKAGGIPWVVDEMPFNDKPTMVMAVNTLLKGKMKQSISMMATVNKKFSKYWSSVKHVEMGDEKDVFTKMVTEALKDFTKTNGIIPARMIVYREGVGGLKNNPTIKMEVGALQEGIINFLREKFPEEAKDDTESVEKLVKKVMRFC